MRVLVRKYSHCRRRTDSTFQIDNAFTLRIQWVFCAYAFLRIRGLRSVYLFCCAILCIPCLSCRSTSNVLTLRNGKRCSVSAAFNSASVNQAHLHIAQITFYLCMFFSAFFLFFLSFIRLPLHGSLDIFLILRA